MSSLVISLLQYIGLMSRPAPSEAAGASSGSSSGNDSKQQKSEEAENHQGAAQQRRADVGGLPPCGRTLAGFHLAEGAHDPEFGKAAAPEDMRRVRALFGADSEPSTQAAAAGATAGASSSAPSDDDAAASASAVRKAPGSLATAAALSDEATGAVEGHNPARRPTTKFDDAKGAQAEGLGAAATVEGHNGVAAGGQEDSTIFSGKPWGAPPESATARVEDLLTQFEKAP